MSFSPYQWRASGGYLPPPDSVPMAVQPVYPPFPYYGQAPMYGGYAHQIAYAPGAGIFGPPGALAAAPPPPAEAKKEKPLPPAPPATNVGSACSSQTTAAATAAPETTYGAPTLRPGINYLYPEKKEHTMLHIFSKASPIWEEKYAKCGQGFKMFKVSIAFTVKNVVERVTRKQAGDECKGWAATEVVERGGGGWEKGTTIEYDSDKAKGSLESMGWNSKRGEGLPPVWLVVHKP